MALSEYEERVFAELEAQFHADAYNRQDPNPARLTLLVLCFLGGVALLASAFHVGLVIRICDFWGATTASVTSAFRLAGSALLLASAILLGGVLSERRRGRGGRSGAPAAFRSTERVQSP